MKCAIVIANDVKQIMFTAETEEEKAALKLITPEQELSVDIKHGQFYDYAPASAAGYMVAESRGGYYRAFPCSDSLMLILRPKKKDIVEEPK